MQREKIKAKKQGLVLFLKWCAVNNDTNDFLHG